jgi:hypothetical protein
MNICVVDSAVSGGNAQYTHGLLGGLAGAGCEATLVLPAGRYELAGWPARSERVVM